MIWGQLWPKAEQQVTFNSRQKRPQQFQGIGQPCSREWTQKKPVEMVSPKDQGLGELPVTRNGGNTRRAWKRLMLSVSAKPSHTELYTCNFTHLDIVCILTVLFIVVKIVVHLKGLCVLDPSGSAGCGEWPEWKGKGMVFSRRKLPPINRCCLVADWNLYKTRSIWEPSIRGDCLQARLAVQEPRGQERG